MLRARTASAFSAGGLFVCLLLSGCGGGGGGSNNPPPPAVAAPSALTYPAPQSLRASAVMTAITPTVTGTVTTYSVSPALPAGLTLNASTGQISGTPTAPTAPANYTVTAANSGGSTNFSLALKVFGLAVESNAITRYMAQGSPLSTDVVLRPLYFDAGTLFAVLTDANGLFLPGVTAVANGNGTFSLRLQANPSIGTANLSGNLTINLYKDGAHTQPQDVPGVTIAYAVKVTDSATTWPGNNLSVLSAWAGASEWSTLQGDAGHTGYVPVSVDPDRFTLRWKTAGSSTWSGRMQLNQNLVTWNGLFFVASSDYLGNGVMYAKREQDGTEAWHFDLTGISYPNVNAAAVANGTVYFAAGHQNETYMYARNAVDGTPVYRATMASQWEGYLAPTIGPNGMLYANAGTYGGMYGFNPAGTQLFFSYEAQQSEWTPAVNATGVYAYTGDRLHVVDPLTGVEQVAIADPMFQNYVYEVGGAPVLGNAALGSVFAAPYTNSLLNGGGIGNYLTNFRSINGGSIAWQMPGVYPTTPAYHNGVVYAVNQNPLRLEARAESDGLLLWSWTPWSNEGNFVSEVLLTDTHAFVSTGLATHVIDLATHQSVWSYPLSGKLALSPRGVLYIQNAADLVAVNLK